ncbi:hypothetical protein M9H77_18596 [Catharanthus roseus]|uniref:Uncharacterized protein n=1 Tax=Catharanthus roseus TaxID=4058 RepID=A0ACC0B862_CATRO|nr:hypothetical protein M9H77_18596 [Catharanthus roseus]
MVRPSVRRRGNDLGPVTDRTGRVEGCTITASSRGLRDRYSTSDISSTLTPFATEIYYDTSAPGSSTQPPHIPIRSRTPLPSHRLHTSVPYDIYGSSHPPSQPPPSLYDPYIHASSIHPHIPYRPKVQEPLNEFSGPGRKLGAVFFSSLWAESLPIHLTVHMIIQPLIMVDHDDDDDNNDDDGDDAKDEEPIPMAPGSSSGNFKSRNKRSNKARDVLAPTQRKKATSSDWEQTGPVERGPIDPALIPSYGEHVAGLLKPRSCYITLTCWTPSDPKALFDVATDISSRLSSGDKVACYIQYLLGSSLFTDKTGNIIRAKL